MTAKLIPHTINASVINQRAGDGYIHATAMCQAAGKKFNDYSRLDATQSFLSALSSDAGIPVTRLINSLQGGNSIQGTWVHPKVAHLAQWLSPQFAVQVTNWVYDWMSGKAHPDSGLTSSGDAGARIDSANLEGGLKLLARLLETYSRRVDGLIVAHDPRIGAVTAIPALQVAIERKADKRPRGFVQRISNALLRHCKRDTRWTTHRDGYGRKLFARPAIDDWLESGGWGPLKAYLDRKGGRTVFTLAPKEDDD